MAKPRRPVGKPVRQPSLSPTLSLVQESAPAPLVDKHPLIVGSALTMQYISSTARMALTGFRQPWIDVLDELLEHEPHGFSMLSKRVLEVAGGQLVVEPATHTSRKARKVADMVERQLCAIPDLPSKIADLAWGVFYGATCKELLWDRTAAGWELRDMLYVHPRRLSMPRDDSWDMWIWDQGMVLPVPGRRTEERYGINIADTKHKFVLYTPKIRGGYTAREGLGRILSTYFAIKRLVMRVSAQDYERFVKPWVVAYWRTHDDQQSGQPRSADENDIQMADRAVKALGIGSLTAVTLPDSVKLEFLKHASTQNQKDFLAYLDASISKAVLGSPYTSEGYGASKSATDSGVDDVEKMASYDARSLASALREQVVKSILILNNIPLKFLPYVEFRLATQPDKLKIMHVGRWATQSGIPVDADRLAEMVGMPVVPNESGKPRPTFSAKPLDVMSDEVEDSVHPVSGAESEPVSEVQSGPQSVTDVED